MNLRDQKIERSTILLMPGELTGLGPALTLQNCRITCRTTARELVLIDTEMQQCIFVAKKKITGYKFLRARFYDCALEGTYSGCDFGKRLENYNNMGDVARCDFTNARLDACRFFNCSLDGMKFSTSATNIVLIHPNRTAFIGKAENLPVGLRIYLKVANNQPPDCTALVDEVELAAKRLRVSPKELLEFASERLGNFDLNP